MIRRPPRSTLFSLHDALPISILAVSTDVHPRQHNLRMMPGEGGRLGHQLGNGARPVRPARERGRAEGAVDRKSTRLNSSHGYISYAVFCLKKKTKKLLRLYEY